MIPVPSQWAQALANPQVQATGGITVTRDGHPLITYPVSSMSITLDRSAQQRRSASISLLLQPSELAGLAAWQHPLAPAGNEVVPFFTLSAPGIAPMTINLGTLPIVTTEATDTGSDLVVKVSASDRSWLLNEAKLLSPYSIPSGSSIAEAIADLAGQAWKGRGILPLALQPTNAMIPSTGAIVKAGKSWWAGMTELADAAGWELYLDCNGVLVGRPIPNPAFQTPVWSTGGLATGPTLAKLKSTRNKIYSAVGVVGTGSALVADKKGILRQKSVPINATAQVQDPSSPLYVGGAFGVVGELLRNVQVTSQAQGAAIAANTLTLQVGSFGALSVGTLPNPALDVDDVITITAPRIGVQGNYVLDGWTLSLKPAGATFTPTVRVVGQP
ncbi:MAG: hypothetical protein ACYDHP_00565 [Ferrimicrobium sp.]